jgi:hypothetical protein
MNDDEYIEMTDETASYPDAGRGTVLSLAYLGLGIAGEGGEVADKIKKIMRDLTVDPETPLASLPEAVKLGILKELGDVEWYQARILKELGYTHDEMREANADKLLDRMTRNMIGGSGDER